MRYCCYCMNQMDEASAFCEKCGRPREYACPPHHLLPGTLLFGKFLVGAAIGEGGFGITYVGRDVNLDIKVAIKEYYPNGYANRNNTLSMGVTEPHTSDRRAFFEKGKNSFLNEARALARFPEEPGIVSVRDFFEENNTAYIVMEYLEGQTLKEYLQENGPMTDEQVVMMLLPVMRSLQNMHREGVIHRDISPDNIMFSGSRVKLLDFGAARTISAEANKSLSVVLKPGYAPEEQYRTRGDQGPWTDIYALCATMYKCVTGITPEDSNERIINDELQPPTALGISVDPRLEAVIMKGMAVFAANRYRNVESLLADLTGEGASPVSAGAPADFPQTAAGVPLRSAAGMPQGPAGSPAAYGAAGSPQAPAAAPAAYGAAPAQTAAPGSSGGKSGLVIGIIAGVVALASVAAILFFVLKGRDRREEDIDPPTEAVTEQEPDGASPEPTEADKPPETSAADPAEPQTTEPRTTEPRTTEPSTTEPKTTEAPTTEPAKGGSTLFHPDRSYYVNEYKAYCFCHETSVQDYVKMRYGPDKYTYDVVTVLDNNTVVTVETKSYNGWTLCVARGVEGWIRSDFLFDAPMQPENNVFFKPWNDERYTYVAATDASLGQEIIPSRGKLSHVGITLYDLDGNALTSYDHVPTMENNTKFYFEMNDELGYYPKPDTTYAYRFYAVVDGVNYYSGTYRFTTLSLD